MTKFPFYLDKELTRAEFTKKYNVIFDRSTQRSVVPMASACHPRALRRAVTNAGGCPTPKFPTLSRYKDRNWSKIFRDRAIAPVLRNLLKSDYRKLTGNLEQVVYLDNLTFLDSNGVLRLVGGVPHAYTIAEAILIIEPCGDIYAAILEDGERFLYYTNNREHADKLAPAIQEWISDVEKRRSGVSEEPKLPIVFKSR